MNLFEWTTHYIDYLNSFKRDLLSKKEAGDHIECEYKAKGKLDYIICENLDENIIPKVQEGSIALVTLNRKDNAKFMIANWNKFITNKNLKIIFANPTVNAQWTIMPYLHNNFTDPAALKTGIKTLFESVAEA
ncbi:MAG: hypothetical protein NDI94_02265 [Candidatus Woesearchaeota archaeon]|nr:hypothetical protein [Candidatus Woesearchaeota archaeon]